MHEIRPLISCHVSLHRELDLSCCIVLNNPEKGIISLSPINRGRLTLNRNCSDIWFVISTDFTLLRFWIIGKWGFGSWINSAFVLYGPPTNVTSTNHVQAFVALLNTEYLAAKSRKYKHSTLYLQSWRHFLASAMPCYASCILVGKVGMESGFLFCPIVWWIQREPSTRGSELQSW